MGCKYVKQIYNRKFGVASEIVWKNPSPSVPEGSNYSAVHYLWIRNCISACFRCSVWFYLSWRDALSTDFGTITAIKFTCFVSRGWEALSIAKSHANPACIVSWYTCITHGNLRTKKVEWENVWAFKWLFSLVSSVICFLNNWQHIIKSSWL